MSMGVYIKGMEMPKNCEECAIKSWDTEDYVCPFSGVSTLCISRQADCPLVPVPTHERLIEKNAVFELIRSFPNVDRQLPVEFMKALYELPTILEAEEGET